MALLFVFWSTHRHLHPSRPIGEPRYRPLRGRNAPPSPAPPAPSSTRHGRTVWYVRVGHGPRMRLRAEFGSPEFEAEYQAAISGQAVECGKKGRRPSGR